MEKQPSLFDLSKLKKTEKRLDLRPVDRPYIKDPEKEDILLLDLNLNNRLWFQKWIERYEKGFNFDKKEILLPRQLELVSKYFYPQQPDGRWLNQSEIIGSENTSSFRRNAILALARIYNRIEVQKISTEEYGQETGAYYGTRAIEYLKPNNELYRYLRDSQIYLVDSVDRLTTAEVKWLCAHQNNYNELEAAMQKFLPGWKRNINYIPSA